MSTISATKMMFASRDGHPPISFDLNRANAITFRRTKKTTQARRTPNARNSNVPIKKS